ncbi:MAG: lipoate--protein ligase family protein [Chloroflexi bacterium]|uniref:lipoyl protein ligase domain-containing protein n=1 Tax=Candidatus Flexifilum breve TaxID=3140694 RepID=UPI0031363048|nr:lipoate--protein ligase family protein [Chloroflexota bacterium]
MIYDPPTRGARNMAVDEAILTAVAAGGVPPTLRFYQWKPACLSLGYGQRAREADGSAFAGARVGYCAAANRRARDFASP